MAAAIRERHEMEVATTPSRKTGEFSVWVDDRCVVKKRLPFLRPSDDKILGAVAAALR